MAVHCPPVALADETASFMSKRTPYKGPDHFTALAKKQGFPARSVFKLEEIDRRVKLLKSGMHILDLGAAPGSWSLYAAQKIGREGKLLAVDLSELRTPLPAWSTFLQADAFDLSDERLQMYAPYDVVLSDMAPSTTGNRLSDQSRSYDLFMRALNVAVNFLKPDGSFVGKIFMGEDFPLARKELRTHFREEKLIRPEGTRAVSYEIFSIGLGFQKVETKTEPAEKKL
jgi:23S rRNA (uridine2552-2'-O)-methyltransferase